jgi:glyoxylase-like metal-dependent hydrolase (beta-lactamase superfamily II)
MWTKAGRAGAAGLALVLTIAAAPKPPSSLRLYIFDCGVIKGLGVELFGFKPGEVRVRDFFVPCYLVAHPKGTLMWDVGVIADSAFKADGDPVTEGPSTVNMPLLPQLAALGYTPADITYLGLSHYHSDHTANANAFAGSMWLVRKADRDVMFGTPPPGAIIQQEGFAALRTAKTTILDTDEYDVFGDGTVVIKSAPGHTPGHQVLFLKLKKYGPVLVAGDLYHYPEERTMKRFPSFEFSKEQSAKSRADIDAFLRKMNATLWIEHDAATNAKLKKAPEYYE